RGLEIRNRKYHSTHCTYQINYHIFRRVRTLGTRDKEEIIIEDSFLMAMVDCTTDTQHSQQMAWHFSIEHSLTQGGKK
ncbi:hypothetical protein PMAYCL1PPCAC_24086, partial [Pristionchus mayeri]